MAKVAGFLLVLLAVLLTAFASEMKWIDLKKTFASEETYTPPPDIGAIWRWSTNKDGMRDMLDITFFEVKAGGEVAVIGSGRCRWPCLY